MPLAIFVQKPAYLLDDHHVEGCSNRHRNLILIKNGPFSLVIPYSSRMIVINITPASWTPIRRNQNERVWTIVCGRMVNIGIVAGDIRGGCNMQKGDLITG